VPDVLVADPRDRNLPGRLRHRLAGHGWISRWNVLGDATVCKVLPEIFRNSPEVVSGLLVREAEQVWREWSLLIWTILKWRGCFVGDVESLPARDLAAKPEMT
jgi:hypothetical protein